VRTLRMSLAGTVILALLAGFGGVVAAQDEAEEPTSVTVTMTEQCNDMDLPCDWTASDPRLTGRRADWWPIDGVEVEGAEETDAGLMWMDVTFEGPEGSWSGHEYVLWGEPTRSFLVLSGTGANEGWQYIAASGDPERGDGFEWTGTLYEGELPPFPEPPAE
jgi:hypothetical protein